MRHFTLITFFLVLGCTSIKTISDQSYFEFHDYKSQPFALLEHAQDSLLTINGIYTFFPIGNKQLPSLIVFQPTKGMGYVPLDDSLNFPQFSYVHISGVIASSELAHKGTRNKTRIKTLIPETSNILKHPSPIIKEFDTDSIFVFVNEQKNHLVIKENSPSKNGKVVELFRVYTIESNKLITIFEREWFQGE